MLFCLYETFLTLAESNGTVLYLKVYLKNLLRIWIVLILKLHNFCVEKNDILSSLRNRLKACVTIFTGCY